MSDVTGYELSKNWFDFSYENPELIKPTHTAMYFFIIDHNNRLGWKEKFGLPMEMTKDAIGIKNYRTYKNTFEDLVNWGFIKVYQKSKNQYSANIIGLVKNTKATTKALSKAIQKHMQKQYKSIVGVDKPINQVTFKPNNKDDDKSSVYSQCVDFWLKEFHPGWTFESVHGKHMKSILTKIKKLLDEDTGAADEVDEVETFKTMCLNLPDWFKAKDLAVVNSKFNEIIQEIKNGKQTSKENWYNKLERFK